MKTYFDETTDKKLLEAATEEEIRAIIAGTPEAEKLADKIDLVMNEISRIKGSLDEEVNLNELDGAACGAKAKDIYLSETQGCVATFYLEDEVRGFYCWSNDQCLTSNEYKYHNTKYSNCKKGGRHTWDGEIERSVFDVFSDNYTVGVCTKCKLEAQSDDRFDY